MLLLIVGCMISYVHLSWRSAHVDLLPLLCDLSTWFLPLWIRASVFVPFFTVSRCLCPASRPPRPPERETHRAASGDRASFTRAAAEAEPPGLPAAVRQAAPEDDRPAADRHGPRAPHPAAEEDRGGHVLTPAAAGDHEGLVLEFNWRKGQQKVGRKTKETFFYFKNHKPGWSTVCSLCV